MQSEHILGDLRSPCMGCAFREPACHGKCEAYREFRAANEARRMARQRERNGESDIRQYKKGILREFTRKNRR